MEALRCKYVFVVVILILSTISWSAPLVAWFVSPSEFCILISNVSVSVILCSVWELCSIHLKWPQKTVLSFVLEYKMSPGSTVNLSHKERYSPSFGNWRTSGSLCSMNNSEITESHVAMTTTRQRRGGGVLKLHSDVSQQNRQTEQDNKLHQ